MAERRMFAKTIIDSDAFIDMPVTSRLLYYDLSMRADDDGFINSPKKIMRMVGASEDDLRILIQRKFIIPFENGVVVIKHWRIHNYIRQDRYKETTYKEEKELLEYDENNAYRLVDQRSTIGLPSDIPTVDPGKVRLGKDSLGKVSIGKNIESKHSHGEYGWVKLSDAEYERLSADIGPVELERCITYVDESAQRTHNKNKWKDWNLVIRKCAREGWGVSRNGTAQMLHESYDMMDRWANG